MTTRLGADRVYEHLWMGSAPPTGATVRDGGFDVLVLCALEYQPRDFPGVEVIHCPLDDDPIRGLRRAEAERAKTVGIIAAHAAKKGRRVLVTCFAGRNRSGLVMGHALMTRDPNMSPTEAIYRIRLARGQNALSNPRFVELLKATTPRVGADERIIWTP